VISVAVIDAQGTEAVLVRPDAEVKDIKDLEGKQIMTTAGAGVNTFFPVVVEVDVEAVGRGACGRCLRPVVRGLEMSIHDDPIELELFKNALFAIADEMALPVFRTTYSGLLKDNMDYSTAFCDADGKLVAQGLTLPGHLGSIPTALDVVVASTGMTSRPATCSS
jgi:Hydantoinase B/oxoprolinase